MKGYEEDTLMCSGKAAWDVWHVEGEKRNEVRQDQNMTAPEYQGKDLNFMQQTTGKHQRL